MPTPFLTALIAGFSPVVPAYEWECDLEECDGKPHGRWDYGHARTKQRRPKGRWKIWLLLCGRGFGKTRTGSEEFLDLVLEHPVDSAGRPTWHLIGCRTNAETVNLMIKGPSSLTQALDRRGIAYKLNGSNFTIELATGQTVINQHAEGNPEFGRGGEWATVWLDEAGTFKRIKQAFTESLPFAMRVKLPNGGRSRILMTTTPKAEYEEPFFVLKDLIAQAATGRGRVVLTRGTTWENVENIPEEDLEEWDELFPPGSRIRRQELDAELLDNVEGSLWTMELLNATRAMNGIVGDVVDRVVFVDPSYTAGPKSDLAGIVMVAKSMLPVASDSPRKTLKEAHFWVEKDISMRANIDTWSKAAVQLAVDNGARLGIEVDNGADMNKRALQEAARDLGLTCPPIVEVRAGSEGSKAARAARPVQEYEAGRVHHLGFLPELETEQTTWVPNLTAKSPDRIDAVVHAINRLLKPPRVSAPMRPMW